MRSRRRREQGRSCPQRPSERAEERLRAAVNRDVADLRLQLEEASLRSDVFLAAGYPEVAAEVVDEKRQLVSRFEARLQQRLSEAAVEAEAERVLAAAPGAAALSDGPTERSAGRLTPALLSAVAAAVLALVAVNGPVTDLGQPSSADGTARSSADHEVEALSQDMHAGPTSSQVGRSAAAPTSEPTGTRTAPQRGTDDLPDTSPTERLVGMIQGFVDAADDTVRDALLALLAEAREPLAPSTDEAPEAEPTERRPSEPEGEASDAGDPAEEAPEDGEDGEDGQNGDLSSVTEPLDMRDEDEGNDGTGDEQPVER